jgi:hypothetical protein
VRHAAKELDFMIKRKQLIIRRRKSQRGMVMVGAMLVLFILLTIVLIGVAGSMNGPSSSGAVTTMNNGMQLVAARGQSVSSFNMAESGVEYTLQWLHEQSSPPNNTSPFAPTLWSGSPSGERQVVTVYDSIGDAVGSFSVRIYPISTNAGNSQKMYVIESVGVCGGFSQIVQAYVQLQ